MAVSKFAAACSGEQLQTLSTVLACSAQDPLLTRKRPFATWGWPQMLLAIALPKCSACLARLGRAIILEIWI